MDVRGDLIHLSIKLREELLLYFQDQRIITRLQVLNHNKHALQITK
jgi:hypothetical protein